MGQCCRKSKRIKNIGNKIKVKDAVSFKKRAKKLFEDMNNECIGFPKHLWHERTWYSIDENSFDAAFVDNVPEVEDISMIRDIPETVRCCRKHLLQSSNTLDSEIGG